MLNHLRRELAPPVFEGDEAKTQVARLLNILILFTLAAVFIFSVVYTLFAPMNLTNLLPEVPLLLLVAVAFALIRRGQVHLVSLLLPAGLWLAFTIVAAFAGGITSPAFNGYLMVVLIAGVLLGGRASLAFAGLSTLAGLALVYAGDSGRLPEITHPYSNLVLWFSNASFFVSGALLLNLATYSIGESLQHAHRELAERKRAEGELLKFRLGIERSDEAVFMTKTDGTIIYVNPAFEKTYGYSKEEALGQTPRILKSGTMRLETYEHFWETLLAKQVVSGELVNKTKDGRLLNIEGSANPILDEKGNLIAFLAVQRDITMRKRAEAALRESEQSLRTVVANAPVILFALDRNGVYTLSEGKGLMARGINSRQVVGKSAFDLHRDNPKIIGALRNAFSGEACNAIFEVGRLVFDVWYSPIRDQNNTIDGVIGVATDVTERRRAQEELRESGERLQQLASSLQEAVWLRDTRTLEILYVNPAYERIWGRTCESFYKDPKSFVEAIHPEDKERVLRAIQGQYEGKSFSEEYRIIRPDGTIRWIFGRTYPIKNEAGETYRITAIAEDITERIRGEQALRESEDRFRGFVEHTSEWILITDEQGNIVEWNPGAQEITGLERAAVIGKPVWDVQYQLVADDHKSPAMYERLKAAVQNSLRTGTSPIMNRVVEAQFRRADGAVRVAEQRLFPITTSEGFRLSGISRDITERKQAEHALKENEQKFRSFIEQASDAFILVDEPGNIIEWNQGAKRIWGLKYDQVIGKPFWEIQLSVTLPERRTREHMEHLKATTLEALRTGESRLFHHAIEAESCGTDGQRRFIQQTMFPIKTDKGYRIGSVTRDITESRQSEEALRESEKRYRLLFENMLDGFAYCKMLYDEQDRPVDFVYLDVNDAFERLTGLKDVVGRQVTEVVPGIKESNPELFELYGRVALTGKPERFEIDFKPLKQWLSVSVYSSEKGYFIAVFDNITERKQAENALRESEERYRRLIELTPDAIFVQLEKRFVLANPAGARLLGAAEPLDLIGQPVLKLIHPDDRETVGERIRQTDEGKKQTPLIEQKYLRLDGTVVEVEAAAMPFVYEGKPAVQVVARDITDRKRAEEQTRLQLRRLNALHMIDIAITGNLDLRVILSIILEQATTQLGVDAAAVLLLNTPLRTLDYVAGRGFHFRAIEKTHLRLNDGYAGRAVRERSTVRFDGQHSTGDSTPLANAWASEGFVSYCGTPLISKGHVQGVLELYHRAPLQSDPEWSAFLETLATQAAIAIDNTTLFNDLQHSNLELTLAYDTTLEGWSRALDLRDKETEGHTQRVVDLTLRLAQKLGVGDNELLHVRRGALLHDIGKMGIPDAILLKPGALTEEEWVIMRKHPEYAHDLISPIAFLRPALDIPYCHHERWDGSGYPRGLKGEEIPLVARAFAVVDVWDALSSDRPYRLAWSKDQVYDYLRVQAGQQFDPAIVKMFLGIIGDEKSA